MTSKTNKVNRKAVRKKAAEVGIFTFSELARSISCSRWTLYEIIKNPNACPHARKRMKELIDV
jgi:hypothetical protein